MASFLGAGPESMPPPEATGIFSGFSPAFVAFWALVLLLALRGMTLVLPEETLARRPYLARINGALGVLIYALTAVFALVIYAYAKRVLD
jgi:hypothetical protein